ncbi:MAG: lasso RiPP family leader peptide-containing protein [Bacteroidetes bacterium]|jgi:hypothetical protein|nr:lasso RiPP family leader peptide-containing protein [Bacteroidota bacterium]
MNEGNTETYSPPQLTVYGSINKLTKASVQFGSFDGTRNDDNIIEEGEEDEIAFS